MDSAPTELYTLSLHDALPICRLPPGGGAWRQRWQGEIVDGALCEREDRKSTRLNSSHVSISYAVFCLKKKKSTSRCTSTFTFCAPRSSTDSGQCRSGTATSSS